MKSFHNRHSRYSRSNPTLVGTWVVLLVVLLTGWNVVVQQQQLIMVRAMTASPFPFDEIQPDGSVVTLLLHGDEHGHEMTDLQGKFLNWWLLLVVCGVGCLCVRGVGLVCGLDWMGSVGLDSLCVCVCVCVFDL
jgi:hypothetical protein